jgi:1-acyl-sn-glycerol-3-phosphate acyltransferase
VVVIFPEGNLSGVARGRMRVPRGGAAWLALRSRAPVVPAYIRGGPQTDQLLRSWVQPSRRAARISFGPAVDLQAYLGRPITRQLVEEVAALFMTKIQDLATPKETNTP